MDKYIQIVKIAGEYMAIAISRDNITFLCKLDEENINTMPVKAMEFARDRNAKVLSITDSARSPMTLYSSCNLVAKSDMVSIVDSLVAPLSVINALVVTLCMQRPDEVKESLTTLENAWNNYQVYLNDEIDFIGEEPVLDYSLIKKDETDE